MCPVGCFHLGGGLPRLHQLAQRRVVGELRVRLTPSHSDKVLPAPPPATWQVATLTPRSLARPAAAERKGTQGNAQKERKGTPVSDLGLYHGTHQASGSALFAPPQPWT